MERDIEELGELWHPVFNREYLQLIEERMINGQYELLNTVPMMTVVYAEKECSEGDGATEIIDALKEQGHKVDEIIASHFYLKFNNGVEIEYENFTVIFVKEGADLYVVNIG